MTLNLPGGSTLQCGRWLWDDMPWNSSKRPPYWNSTSGFDLDHITTVDMSLCTSLRNFIQIGPPSAEINDVMSIFKSTHAASVVRCSHKTTTKCLWRVRRYTPETEVKPPNTTPLVITWSQRLRITFLLHMALYKFFYMVLYCIIV